MSETVVPAGQVMTVLGPVAAEALGATLAHEHVFFDLGCYFTPAPDDPDGAHGAAPVAPERLWWLRAHPMNSRANLVQSDVEVAVAEVGAFKEAGGGALVDVTTVGIAPNPAGLVAVSRRSGVHIVAGTGYYLGASYEAEVGEVSAAGFAERLRAGLDRGIAGSTVRAGLIGELGLSDPPTRSELRVLEGAGIVQRERGCAVTVHPSWGVEGAMRAARLAEEVGLDPRRTSLCHLDNRLRDDLPRFLELAARGFYLNLDCFGRELYYPHANAQLPSDAERIRTVQALLDAGHGGRLLLAQDICFVHELVRHGGHGYAHVLRTIRPRLLRSGVAPAALDTVLIDNPRAWLTGAG